MKLFRVKIFPVFAFVLAVSCMRSTPVTQGGGGSEVEVVGYIFSEGSIPASNTQVKLIPVTYDPSTMAAIPDSMIDTTDAEGRYTIRFNFVAPDIYNVQAVELTRRTRLLVTGIEVDEEGDTVVVPSDSLLAPGTIRLTIPGDGLEDGFALIPGTDISVTIGSGKREIVLDSIPVGLIPQVRCTRSGDSVFLTLDSIEVTSLDTVTFDNPVFRYKKKLLLNTSASGADIKEDLYRFPVLVRLDESRFDFTEASDDGSDIQFVRNDTILLPFEIEQWSAEERRAAVWVLVDTVFGNDSTQSIALYSGNKTTVTRTVAGMVFDTADGYQGVWHLGDAAGDSVADATGNHYSGISPENARPQVGTGVVGDCREFDRTSTFITVPYSADGKLNFPENGTYTISAWVRCDATDDSSYCIVSKGYQQYYLRSTHIDKPMRSDVPLWEFVEFGDTDKKWRVSNSPAEYGEWTLVTGVRQGDRQVLYCNGVPVDSIVDEWSPVENVARKTDNDLFIGRFAEPVTVPINEGYCGFKGGIDEVRILKRAQGPEWIRLCYMNQRSDDRLVEIR